MLHEDVLPSMDICEMTAGVGTSHQSRNAERYVVLEHRRDSPLR